MVLLIALACVGLGIGLFYSWKVGLTRTGFWGAGFAAVAQSCIFLTVLLFAIWWLLSGLAIFFGWPSVKRLLPEAAAWAKRYASLVMRPLALVSGLTAPIVVLYVARQYS